MDPQDVVLVALAIVLGASGLAALVLGQPLYATIIDPNRTVARARFWRGYVGLVVVLVPLVTTLFSLPIRARTEPAPVLQVAEQVRTPLAALAVTLVLLGPVILLVPGGPGVTVAVTPEQADDLARLLAKVDVIRAREVLRREAEESGAFSPSSSRRP
jgi:hypothetical protein